MTPLDKATRPIQAEGLTKRYGETLALDGLDLSIEPGEVYGYLGPNGAGKTTTIRLLLGIHRPTRGRAALFGIDAWADPVEAHRRAAYVSGEPFLWPGMTGAETIEFLARLHGGTDRAYRDELVQRFELDTKKKVRALSKGNRQKVQLVAALATRADLLVLDEPTSGLDPLMEMAFRECIREAKERGQAGGSRAAAGSSSSSRPRSGPGSRTPRPARPTDRGRQGPASRRSAWSSSRRGSPRSPPPPSTHRLWLRRGRWPVPRCRAGQCQRPGGDRGGGERCQRPGRGARPARGCVTVNRVCRLRPRPGHDGPPWRPVSAYRPMA